MLQDEETCDSREDNRTDDREVKVSLFAQCCTMVASDLLVLQCLDAVVQSSNVRCCLLLFHTSHLGVVVCVQEAFLLRAQWHKRKTGVTAFLRLSQEDLRDL